MKPWTDMEALCEAIRQTKSREEALRLIREAPPATVPFWGQDEDPPTVALDVVSVGGVAANDPEVA